MSTNIRLATIGTSVIVDAFLTALAKVPGIEAVAAYSRELKRAEEFAARHAIARAFDTLDELYRSDEVDAVYIASPNGVHYAQAKAALQSRKHVIVEKPATLTANEFRELIEIAAANDVVVFEAMRPPYDPGIAKVQELLGQVGTLRLASFEFCSRSSRYADVLAGKSVNIFDPALGGGALRDLGVYPLSIAVHLFGFAPNATATLVPITSGADGAGTVTLDYDGFIATNTFSKISTSDRPNHIQGELGTIEFFPLSIPERITLKLHGHEPEVFELTGGFSDDEPIEGPSKNMEFEIQRFVELIAGADPVPDHARTLAVLRLVDDALTHFNAESEVVRAR